MLVRAMFSSLSSANRTSAASMNGLVPQLTSMMSRCTVPLNVSVHYTRATTVGKVITPQYLPPNFTLHPGRADILEHLQTLAVQANALGMKSGANATSGMIVSVCGPTALSDSVAQVVGCVDPKLRDRIGGIELFEEQVPCNLFQFSCVLTRLPQVIFLVKLYHTVSIRCRLELNVS